MITIKFGTDGWRAIIAQEFTVDNVARVAEGTALWLKKNFSQPKVVLGYDCRFGGELFAETTARILCKHHIKVYLSTGFVSTPMVSLATLHLKAQAGVIITASHNPPSYNGYKLKAGFGGPALPSDIEEVEKMVPEIALLPSNTLADFEKEGYLEYYNLEEQYILHLKNNFDLSAIYQSGLIFAYDAMYGAGQNVMKKLFPKHPLLHCSYNPSFNGQAPEPLHKNLLELSETIKQNPQICAGIATDGDADRIGMYDHQGNFIDSHHIILLLIHYLHKYKKLNGKVVIAFSVSDKAKKLCELYNLPYQVTKIGFKYICQIMVQPNENILLGGEESGGIALTGHIPERDGLWMGLTLIEFMAKTGKSLQELIQEIYTLIGEFYYHRNDLHITNELKNKVLHNCEQGLYTSFGHYNVQRTETIDGYKYHLNNHEWVMIRASGTEPVLRIYAESNTSQGVLLLLKTVEKTLLG